MLRRAAVRPMVLTALLVALVAAPAASAAAAPPSPPHAFSGAPEEFPQYRGQVSCDPATKPGTAALARTVRAAFGGGAGSTSRPCSQGGRSEHKEGRAWDWTLNAGNAADHARADAFFAWVMAPDSSGRPAAVARRLGIMYLIWDHEIWHASRPQDGWQPYSGPSPHTDHVHVSLTWDGAWGRTSWWTGRTVTAPDAGPCRVYAGQDAPVLGPSRPNHGGCPSPLPAPPAACGAAPAGAPGALPAVRRGATWLTRSSLSSGEQDGCFALGDLTDVPLYGDWDGDGVATPAVYRPSTSTWYLSQSPSGAPVWRAVRYGAPGDVPVVGDWDADGDDSLGVFRPSTGTWYLSNRTDRGTADGAFGYGSRGDVPVAGDWDGDGTDTLGVYRPSQGRWYVTDRLTPGPQVAQRAAGFGSPGDQPVAADWDGDGRDDPGVFRPSWGRWYLGSWQPGGIAQVDELRFGSINDRAVAVG